MNLITILKNRLVMRLTLMAGLLFGCLDHSVAADKVYINDFSIKGGETKEIAINYDTEATDVSTLMGTIVMPAGLTIVEDAYGIGVHAKAESSRASGTINLNPVTGAFGLVCFGSTISDDTGAVAYFKVKAANNIAAGEYTIKLNDFKAGGADVATGNATVTCAAAPTYKIYIEDFSIQVGETKDIPVVLETSSNDIKSIEGTIDLPEGLTADKTIKVNETNAPGFEASRFKNGSFFMESDDATAKSGIIAYLTVIATADLAATSNIVLSDFMANETSTMATENATVTCAAEIEEVACAFAVNSLNMLAGESKDVEVLLTNSMTLAGMQAAFSVTEGISITGVTKSSRLSNINYNNGKMAATGGISGNEGTVFTITLQADADFVGEATLSVSSIVGTTSASVRKPMEDIVLTVTVEEDVTLVTKCAFAEDQINITAGQSKDVEVILTNGMTLTGLSAQLAASEGITIASVTKSDRLSSMNYSNGNMVALGGISGNDGAVFTVTLKSNDDFTGRATLTISNIVGTTPSSSRKPMDNIVLNVNVQGLASVTVAPKANTLTYNGSAQALIEAGTAVGGVMQYSLDGVEFSADIPTATDAGSYLVYYKVEPAENYVVEETTETPSVNVSIAKATLTDVTLSATQLFFNKEEQTVNVTSVKAGDVDVPAEACTVSGNTATDVGSYTIVVEAVADGNFQGKVETQFSVVTNPEDLEAFDAYKTEQKAAVDALAKEGDSEACQQIISDAKNAIDALNYDETKTLDENKAEVDAIIAPLAEALDAQRAQEAAEKLAADKAAFDAYKTEQKAAADALAEDGDSEAAQQLISDAKATIDALNYDETKTLDENKAEVDAIIASLPEALDAQRAQEAAEKLAADKAAFDAYKTTQKGAADALAKNGDSDACKKIISDAKAAIDALTYDETKTLDENKANVDAIIAPLAEALDAQRAADKLAADQFAFLVYKIDQKDAADALAEDGDSEAAKKLIEDAKDAIDDLAYDEAKTLDENKAEVRDIVTKLNDDLTALRIQEAGDQLAADKAAFAGYKKGQKIAADALLKEDDSDACKKIISDAKAAINALTYDETKTLGENKANVDAIIAPLAEALDAQRAQEAAEKLAADKAAFDAYKTDQKATADALAEEGDSEACQKIISDAKDAIDALTYDEAKTLDENKADVDAIIAPLAEALDAQRAKDVADQAEADAKEAALKELENLKSELDDLIISDDIKNSGYTDVQNVVDAAEQAVNAAQGAVDAVEAKIAEGDLATTNKDDLAGLIEDAKKAIDDAKQAIADAEAVYYEKATSISVVKGKVQHDVIYDMNGVRITQGILKKGIYIVNGKKVVIR